MSDVMLAHRRRTDRAVEDIWQDITYGWRALAGNKAFAIAAIITLTFGLGATTAIFSLVNGVVFKPLPFADPDRLVQMYGTPAIRGEAVSGLAAIREQSRSFDALVAYNLSAGYLQSADGPERVMSVAADREFFAMLGVAPVIGRGFRRDDPTTVAVISDEFWKRVLGGTSSAIGARLAFNNTPLTVIGIMPEGFQFPYGAASVLHSVTPQARTDLWMPLDAPTDPSLRGRVGYVTGRLKPEVTIQEAVAELAVITKRLQDADPDPYGARGVRLEPLADVVVARPIRRSLFVLLASVIIVLALAAANVANLSLVRMTLRSREVATRAALGAGPLRLIRQFLTESLVLSVFGAIGGLLVAWWGVEWLTTVAASQLPRAREISIDGAVFGFLLIVCVVVGLLIGIMPAMMARRADTQRILQATGGHTTIGGRLSRLRDLLVVVEIACALVMAVGAVSLVRELMRLQDTDIGLEPADVVTFHLLERPPAVPLAWRGSPPETQTRPFYEIADRVRTLPGVRAAGFTQVLPLQNWGWSANSIDFRVAGRPPRQGAPFTFDLRYVTPGYFEALGISIRRGRSLTSNDTRDAPPVIVINQTMARLVFQDVDPIGQTTTRGTVVGVVGDIRNVNLDQETLPEVYYPIAQNWSQLSELGMTLVVRTEGPPGAIVEPVRKAVREINPNEAIFDVKTMDQIVAESMSSFTLYLRLMMLFAALALGQALTGTYGVMAYAAESRSREYAVRAAVGAGPLQVMRLVLRKGLYLTGSGIAVGLVLAVMTAPVLRALPVSVRPPGAASLSVIVLLMGCAAMIACAIPARRASQVDLMATLRNE
jgi:predicted permease